MAEAVVSAIGGSGVALGKSPIPATSFWMGYPGITKESCKGVSLSAWQFTETFLELTLREQDW